MRNKMILLIVLVMFLGEILPSGHCRDSTVCYNEVSDTGDESYIDFLSMSPEEGLFEALEYYGVQHPDIVYAQAILETGYFTSRLCKEDHNLFGLYNSRTKKYYKFSHWTESIVAYLDYIQYRYEPPDDYYRFLDKIGYAEDPYYTNKLKSIVKRNDKRRTSKTTIVPD